MRVGSSYDLAAVHRDIFLDSIERIAGGSKAMNREEPDFFSATTCTGPVKPLTAADLNAAMDAMREQPVHLVSIHVNESYREEFCGKIGADKPSEDTAACPLQTLITRVELLNSPFLQHGCWLETYSDGSINVGWDEEYLRHYKSKACLRRNIPAKADLSIEVLKRVSFRLR